ncbi:MAG: DUF1573 domain-containing protein [Planctomycetaceae bacterium]|nr:MAG: DUF1573 domain-containing protein [Planctomycetaceae bacterium]
MFRNPSQGWISILLLTICWLPFSGLARADWATAMFPVKNHDFGDVAVASKSEYRFAVRNETNRAVHISSVRTSCGCTTATVETSYIEPGQVGSILAKFNTDTHRGKKGATITVVFDQPGYAEVRLRVDGYIRKDLVFSPGAVEFGKVPTGQESIKTIRMSYAGREDWQVVDVQSRLPWLTAKASLENRSGGNATYLVSVRLDPGAPVGTFQDELIVVTNDRTRPRMPLLVSGELESELVVSPHSLALGEVKPGEVIEKRLVVRGKTPFLIESIRVKGWEVDYDAPTEMKTAHVLPIRLTANGDAVGQFSGRLIVTTGGGLSTSSSSTVTAIVRGK